MTDYEGTHFFYDNDEDTMQIAKEKIVAAHNEISALRLYDPNRGGIKTRLVDPARAAIKKLNRDMELEIGPDLEICDTNRPYPSN